jgi:hypothetical protein
MYHFVYGGFYAYCLPLFTFAASKNCYNEAIIFSVYPVDSDRVFCPLAESQPQWSGG